MDLTIRRARPEEAEAVAELWLRARKVAVPAIPAPVHGDDDVREHFATVIMREHEVWVAEAGGALVGMLVLEGDDWLDQLYVEPGETGQGIGTRLLDVAKRRRPKGLRLWTFVSNEGARRFYERHRFVEERRTDGDNEEGAPDVLYVWAAVSG